MEKLANQRLMPIPIKAVHHQLTEIGPGKVWDLGLNGLIAQRRGTIKVHLRNANPQEFLNIIHAKIFLSTRAPTLRIVAIELRKRNLR
jgi:hypothetical protein